MKLHRALLLLLSVALLTACGEKKRARAHIPAPPPPITTEKQPPAEPPTIADNSTDDKYKDATVLYTQTGMASWYGPPYHNRRGANGEVFDMNALTAAHRTLPLNSVVRVTNLKTDHSAIVRITDRGPFVPIASSTCPKPRPSPLTSGVLARPKFASMF